MDDIELRRNDRVFLDALGTDSIPDPTTAGDFCRRFDADRIEALTDAINETRLEVWQRCPRLVAETARIDGDGTLVPTTGACKKGMDIAYNGIWGYGPLLVSLANTGEPLFIKNRGGNPPSHEGAIPYFGYIRVSQLMKCPDEACFIAVSTYLTGYATGSESVQEPTVR